jgi:Serine dehydrogenase proteinase
MPGWGEILLELQQTVTPAGGPDLDKVRRKYLGRLKAQTGRETIIYYTDWLGGAGAGTSIALEDMTGMMEVCRGLKGPDLDLLLHSPGGSAEATAALVRYLRQKFTHIRVFVPLAAMSAATMWAMAADEIVMGKHSQLGPIDPQLQLRGISSPARGILDQFKTAKDEVARDARLLGAWAPILQQYGPSLLDDCVKAERLSRGLVASWLAKYMFKGEKDASVRARRIARYFGAYRIHQSHAMGIDRDVAREKGLKIEDLEKNQDLQDAVLSVHHSCMHTFNGPCIKLIENHLGRAYVKISQGMSIPFPIPIQPPQQFPPIAPPPPPLVRPTGKPAKG